MARTPCRRRTARCVGISAPKAAQARSSARRRTSLRGRRSIAHSPPPSPPTATIGVQHSRISPTATAWCVRTSIATGPSRWTCSSLPTVRSRRRADASWRGTLDEANAPPDLLRFFDDAFTFSEARSAGHILAYFIPGDGADTTPGKRRVNWVWYVGVGEADLPRLLVDRDGRQHHASLPFGGTPDSAISDLRNLARRDVHPMLAALVAATPQPFLQTIVDVVPTHTVFGRVCLLGDAAFVVRPHTAGATAKAARDATALARALKRAGRNVDAGLSGFEEMQIEFGRGLVDYGVALGRR